MTRLEVKDVLLSYGLQTVLRGVSFCLQPGEVVGLIGPNGSGKSSLLRSIAGLSSFNHGYIAIDGITLANEPIEFKRRFGYAVDPALLPKRLTGKQCVELVANLRKHDGELAASYRLADALGLTPWINRPVACYSLGTRQKLAILIALYGQPQLLVLDEILNGLDPLAAYALKQELKIRSENGATVLLATHGLEVAERFLDRALLQLDGKIEADWGASELAEFRSDSNGGLEHAVIQRLRSAEGMR
jgi:ABC-2 type transport system ATP-binding protein